MKIVAYLRVSTRDQDVGLDVQDKACLDFSTKLRVDAPLDSYLVFRDEGVSGSLPFTKRPGLMSAIQNLSKDDILLVYRRDRLGRDAYDLLTVEREVLKRKASIVSVSGEGNGDTPADRLMRTILYGASEYEKEIIVGRIKDAMQNKRRKMERVGHIPYGFMLSHDGNTLLINEEEKNIIKMIREWRKSGITLFKCIETLNCKKIFNRGGKRWSYGALHRISIRKDDVLDKYLEN